MSVQQSLDRRSRRSRAALEGALLELVTERELAQISVADLTKRADVHRTTFYEHYTDVHDLAASACTGIFDELIAATPLFLPQAGTAERLRERAGIADLFTAVAERAPLYRALLGPDGSARVINHLHHRLTIAVHIDYAAWRCGSSAGHGTHADDPADIPHDPASALLAGALLGVITDWLRRGCPGTPVQLGDATWEFMNLIERAGRG